jgi:hypothetical protein
MSLVMDKTKHVSPFVPVDCVIRFSDNSEHNFELQILSRTFRKIRSLSKRMIDPSIFTNYIATDVFTVALIFVLETRLRSDFVWDNVIAFKAFLN